MLPSHITNGRFLFFLCALFFCPAVKAQLTTAFKADVVAGCAPVLVKFTDLSTGGPTSWYWDLGNGNISFQQNPGTLYFNPGTYDVKLVIKNATNADSLVKTNYIVISNDPEVIFSVNNTTGCVPFKAQFTDNSNAGFGSIVKWEWDFGDGGTSLLQSPLHTYNVDGDVTVTLKVTNSSGCIKLLRKPSLLHINPSPVADFTTGSSVSCNPPAVVNFINTSAGAGNNATWSFGDGATSSDKSPSHIYTQPGNYPVKLVVNNQFGCVNTVTKPIIIGSVTPDFSTPDTVCQGAQVTFKNTSFPATTSSAWTFGDGTTSVSISPVKIYSSPGNYTVKLINNFGACTDSVTKRIYVIPNPVVDFSFAAPSSSCSLPAGVSFTANIPAASYAWSFGDGGTSSDASPTHDYAAFGSYTVGLTITSVNGCTVTASKPNIISIVPPHINSFSNLPFAGCLPHRQNFAADITSPEPITDYQWNFGDGSKSSAQSPIHTYTTEGTFTVSLQITTAGGCHDTLIYPAAVITGSKPVAGFSASPRVVCAHDNVSFLNTSSGSANNFLWIFGDGFTSTVPSPAHHYLDTGFFSVKLIAGSYYCYDTVEINDYVYIKPPVSRFNVLYNCDTPYNRSFVNKSVAAETLEWDFGDNSTSTEDSLVHTYAATGSYNVNLHVTNGTCFDDLLFNVRIIDAKPDFTTDNTVTCRNTTSLFTATKVNTEDIADYRWNFGDSTDSLITTVPSASYTYFKSGLYSPTLTVTDILGCKRVVEHSVTTTVNGPVAGFTNPEGTCINTPIAFTDQSQPFGIYPIAKWMISYGDGMHDTTEVAPSFVHFYTAAGLYNVVLSVTDSFGCTDSVVKTGAVNITDPIASFGIKDFIKCANSPVALLDSSKGLDLSYNWSFGDGTSGNLPDPGHQYAAPGKYVAALTVTDKYGCTSSYTNPDSILISNAKAAFSVSDSVISCPPAQLSFMNSSLYSTDVSWDFDDGSFSNLQNPSHYFSSVKVYHIKLTAYGYGSCSDSVVKTVAVNGPQGSFTYSPLTKCVPANINFAASVVNTQKLVWDYGDGTTNSTSDTLVSHQFSQIGSFLPKLLLIDTTANCTISLTGTDTIYVAGARAYIKEHASLFCDSAVVQFTDSSDIQKDHVTSYVWRFGDGNISPLQNPSHTYPAAGVYAVSLTIQTESGCIDSSHTTFVSVLNSPVLLVTGDTTLCAGQSASFSASLAKPDTSSLTWNWNFGNDSSSVLRKPPAQIFQTAGNYPITVSVTNSNGCSDSSARLLLVYPIPNVFAGLDSTICRGQSIVLVPTGAQSYQWKNNSTLSCTACTSPTASPLGDPVDYYVTGTGAGGCKASDTITIKIIQPFRIAASLSRDTICLGDTTSLLATGSDVYTWSPSSSIDHNDVANPIARPDSSVTYTVSGLDSNSCFIDTASIRVVVYPIPVFNIIPDNVTISVGNSVTLTTASSEDVIRWQWSPSTGLSCTSCPQPVATPPVNTTYTAIASNQGGCTARDQVTIQVFCKEGNVFIPNTFSPNNDGSNDVFYPRGKGIGEIKKMQVFNRWGNLIFQKNSFAANDASAGWNGTINGQPANADVYIYQFEVICLDNEMFSFKGNVTLIR